MSTLIRQAEMVLRCGVQPPHRLALLVVLFGPLYGAVMGAFGGIGLDRLEQILYSALKVPLLLLATFAICLPSFFLLNTLLAVRRDFAEVLRALTASQASLAVVLAALAPYTALWYFSVADYGRAQLPERVPRRGIALSHQGLELRPFERRATRLQLLVRTVIGAPRRAMDGDRSWSLGTLRLRRRVPTGPAL